MCACVLVRMIVFVKQQHICNGIIPDSATAGLLRSPFLVVVMNKNILPA